MRLLLVGNFLSSATGTRGVSEDLAEHFSSLGWTILSTSRRASRWARLTDYLSTILILRSEYEIAHVEVYSGWAFALAEIACLALDVANKPYVITLHGGNLPAFARRWPGRVKRLLRKAGAVVVPSGFLYEQMKPYRTPMTLLPNSLNLDAYTFRHRCQPNPSLIWLRAFHQIYNPTLAVKAASRLIHEFPDLRLSMIGPDKRDGSLQATIALAEGLNLRERLRLPGSVTKLAVPAWLECGDIFINTSNVDNAPVSVLEAMATGLCIVSTDVGGIQYLLSTEKDALLVPREDPVAMADAVRRILTEPGLAAHLSRNARAKAEAYDWSAVLPKWEALLSRLAATVAEEDRAS